MKKLSYLFIILISILLVSCKGKSKPKYYTIDFESYGGTPINSITLKEGSKLDNYEIPEKEGFIFSCWCIDKDATIAYNTSFEINYNLKLYAAYTEKGAENVYSINYITFGISSDEIPGQTGIKYLPQELPTPTSIQAGFVFEGWYDTYDEDSNIVTGNKLVGGMKLESNLTLYAKFILI